VIPWRIYAALAPLRYERRRREGESPNVIRHALLLPALLLALGACQAQGPLSPEERATVFLSAIISQDARAFWDSIDRPSKETLAQIAGVDPDAKDAPERILLVQRFQQLVSLKQVKPKATPPPEAIETTVELESMSGELMPLHLVREDGVWKVHLPLPAPASAPASATTPQSASVPTSAPASTPASAPSPAK
jgi:hypothetical protein